jgi:hypothetical protein
MRCSHGSSWAHCVLGLLRHLGRGNWLSGTELIGYAECAGKSVGCGMYLRFSKWSPYSTCRVVLLWAGGIN